jgi:hypothetical protein
MRKILVYLVGSKMEDICAPLQAEHDTHKFPWVKVCNKKGDASSIPYA